MKNLSHTVKILIIMVAVPDIVARISNGISGSAMYNVNIVISGSQLQRAHPDTIANLPGLTSWSGFITEDGWVTMEFDLSAYAGETVLIGFRYMTDWATLYEGWHISEAIVRSTTGTNTSLSRSRLPSHSHLRIRNLRSHN